MWVSVLNRMGWFAGSPEFIGGLFEALSVLSSWTIRIAVRTRFPPCQSEADLKLRFG